MKNHIVGLYTFVFKGVLFWLMSSSAAFSQEGAVAGDCEARRYTFSWVLESRCINTQPRGGTSKGATLVLDPLPHAGWLALQKEGLSEFEKDRLAILAMSGPYRTSFEFIEVVGYSSEFEATRPYQSWGTEYVYVVDERDDFISLQHIMVMFMDMGDDGGIVGPIVQKHWRQDWQYEKSRLYEFVGHNTWAHQSFSADQVAGSWAQSVYQVDDSPRYEAYGKWQHKPNFSTWVSEQTWRPVPRRESSVRQDYQVLEGTNRHTIVPNGWVHEEQNYKVKLDEQGEVSGAAPYLAKELGLNRYERIVDFDFSAGDDYWQSTSLYWADVRAVWQTIFDSAEQHKIATSYEGMPLFGALFDGANNYSDPDTYDSEVVKAELLEILANYIQ